MYHEKDQLQYDSGGIFIVHGLGWFNIREEE